MAFSSFSCFVTSFHLQLSRPRRSSAMTSSQCSAPPSRYSSSFFSESYHLYSSPTQAHVAASFHIIASNSPSPLSSSAPSRKIKYQRLAHAGMLVENTEKSLKFYTEVLGMRDETDTRPNLPFGGAFVGCGDGSQIHLMELPSVDPKEGRPDHGGRDKHVAINISNIDPLIESLQSYNWKYTMSKSGRRAVFTRDLDGNAIEFVEVAE